MVPTNPRVPNHAGRSLEHPKDEAGLPQRFWFAVVGRLLECFSGIPRNRFDIDKEWDKRGPIKRSGLSAHCEERRCGPLPQLVNRCEGNISRTRMVHTRSIRKPPLSRHIFATVGYNCSMRPPVVLLYLAASLVVLAACSAGPPPAVGPSVAAPPPIEGGGDWVRFELLTHCGLDGTVIEFDGEHWEARGPGPLNDGSGNPPAGFGNPFDQGWIVRIDADEAGYQSSLGVPLFLHRLEELPEPEACM